MATQRSRRFSRLYAAVSSLIFSLLRYPFGVSLLRSEFVRSSEFHCCVTRCTRQFATGGLRLSSVRLCSSEERRWPFGANWKPCLSLTPLGEQLIEIVRPAARRTVDSWWRAFDRHLSTIADPVRASVPLYVHCRKCLPLSIAWISGRTNPVPT